MEGGLKYTGGHEFLERKIGGHNIFDDQNVVCHKMTAVCLFLLACLGGRCIGDGGVIKFVLPKWGGGGRSFIDADFL